MSIQRVDWLDPRAVAQRAAMDAETTAMYLKFIEGQTDDVIAGMQEAFAIDPADITATILAVEGDEVLGHTALRPAIGESTDVLEVKKVFVGREYRGRGISRTLMLEAESIAKENGATALVLQTGDLQVPAITLYLDLGYVPVPPFGKYHLIPGALCYRKELSSEPASE
ncbi:hypothetical protein BH10ACT7_BH10ACT7_14630 [soil metagenome]